MAANTPGPEMRWFFPTNDPRTALLDAWIKGAARGIPTTAPVGPELRDDVYAVPTLPNVGLKQRGKGNVAEKPDGKLEVKLRLATRSSLGGSLAGRVEHWIKLAPDPLSPEALSLVRWLPVHKERRLVKWSESRRSFVPKFVELTDGGCTVELTALTLPGERTQVSFALEAFGTEPQAEAAFQGAVARISAELPGLAFTESESLGYPEWLSRVA